MKRASSSTAIAPCQLRETDDDDPLRHIISMVVIGENAMSPPHQRAISRSGLATSR